MHFVLVGVLLSVLSGKVLISEIYQFLKRNHSLLCTLMGVDFSRSISDVQLRRLLDLTDVTCFQKLNAIFFKYTHSDIPNANWVSFDGKEIRGTIDGVMGQKRELNLVHPCSW